MRGRPVMETLSMDGYTFKTQWTYNSANQVHTITYPGGGAGESGETLTYGYLPQGLPTSLSGSGGITYINVARYDASGRPTYIRQNGVISRHWDYYPWKVYGTNPQDNNPGGLKAIGAGNDAYPWTRQNMTYNYDDAAGNIDSIIDGIKGETLTYTYDNQDRLTGEAVNGSAAPTVAYDTYGRMSSRLNLNYTYSGLSNRVTQLKNSSNVLQYSYNYDANGNVTQKAKTQGSTYTYNFTYDIQNQLVGVSGLADGQANAYAYDGDGRRVRSSNVYQNVAPGAWVYSSCGASCFATNAYAVSDGDVDVAMGVVREYAQSTQNGVNDYALYDLGTNYSINKLKIWHYNSDGRKFHGTKLEYQPSGGSTWTTVFSSTAATEYNESLAGREYTFTATPIRKTRDWLNGNTVDNTNRWVEMELWGYSNIYYVNQYYEFR